MLLCSCGTLRDIGGMFDDDAEDDANVENQLQQAGSSGNTVSTGTGKLCIWTGDYYMDLPADVYVDGTFRGTVTRYFSYPPNAGTNGTVTISVSAGYHTIYARCSNGTRSQSDSWLVTKGQTSWYELFAAY